MNRETVNPVVLEAPIRRERTWLYPWIGLLFGVFLGIFIGHPLSMLIHNFHGWIDGKNPLEISGSLFHSFHLHMWPMMLIFSLFGAVVWGFIGFIFQRLREKHLRLNTLHQEFELQVATLRHHYKNLALGIHGFSGRIRRKLAHLDETFCQCLAQGTCPTYDQLQPDFASLTHNFAILEEAAQRLMETLGQELLFLKALTSDTLKPVPSDFYPFLIHCIQDLQGLRFREKEVRVEVNGRSLEECQDSLVFPFEPYTMEVILQNIIGNAMKYGDLIQIRVNEKAGGMRVDVQDNGPGLDVEKLRSHLLIPGNQREAESTQLGLKVSIHLLAKGGGRLLAWSKPGAGAVFTIEIPKHPRKLR